MKIKNFKALIAVVVPIWTTHAAHAQDAYTTTPLSVSAANWTATDANGNFADTWASGTQKLAFVLPLNTPHFELRFLGFPANISKGTAVKLQLTFDKATHLELVALANKNMLIAPIPDTEAAALTHDLTADQNLVIAGLPGDTWTIPLNGTTPTISTMADAISFAGIKGLPAPFDNAMDNPTRNPPPPILEATSFKRCGYDFVIFDQNMTIPDPASDSGAETLVQELPQIINPMTPQAVVFNQSIKNFVETTWANYNWPKTINSKSNLPDDDYYLWAGAGSWDNEPTQDMQNMLQNVISIRFVFMDAVHGAGAGRSVIDFNWLLTKERQVKLSDIFDPGTNWRKAMIESVNAQRPPWPGNYPEPDLSNQISDNPSAWLLRKDGIELTFSQGDFDGSENGGELAGPVVPWSSLKAFLKKGGLVSAEELNSAN
jgi:hypothetical protein